MRSGRHHTILTAFKINFSLCISVGNIPYEATEEKLKEIFSEVGPVLSLKWVCFYCMSCAVRQFICICFLDLYSIEKVANQRAMDFVNTRIRRRHWVQCEIWMAMKSAAERCAWTTLVQRNPAWRCNSCCKAHRWKIHTVNIAIQIKRLR